MLHESEVIARNNVKCMGNNSSQKPTLLMAHGFGCDQNMWRFLVPKLEKDYQIVLFDYVGSGASDFSYYHSKKYAKLEAYAQDIIDICVALDLQNVCIVGHSISSIIGAIAAEQLLERVTNIVMVCPSPCFLNLPPDYMGGFEKEDLEELLSLMDKNYIGWANHLAPLVMGKVIENNFTQELSKSFCSTDPIAAKNFARATFFCDYRDLLSQISVPVLLLQSKVDSLASIEIGEFMHKQLKNSELHVIEAEGHCLHMTHPNEISERIIDFKSHG